MCVSQARFRYFSTGLCLGALQLIRSQAPKKKKEKHNRLFLLASGWEEAIRWKSISLRSLLVIHISGSQGFLCSAVLCASAVVDRKMDVALWTEGGRTKCLVHLIDLVQWSLRRRDSIQQETDA